MLKVYASKGQSSRNIAEFIALQLKINAINNVFNISSTTSTQGVGIAESQIGESVQIIVVASRPTARYAHAPLMSPTVMMNPSFQLSFRQKVCI
jgi:peptide deformylase